MPKRTKAARRPKPAQYPTAPEEISVAGTPPAASQKKARSKATRKKAAKKGRKQIKKASKARTSAPASVQIEQVTASPKPKRAKRQRPQRKGQGKSRALRRNPSPQIEAAFYQLGALTEFEFEEEGETKRFAFEKPPVLAADTAGKLRVVYDPTNVRGAKVPQRVTRLHETFNGFSPDRHMAGVFGKKVPGTRAMGVLKALTYFSEKCVDAESCSSPGHYRHAFEAPFPRVLVNPAGLVLIEGGSYEITRAGIIH